MKQEHQEPFHGFSSLDMRRFLDLGCAPGGFAACLLQDHLLGPLSVGYGVSLPPELGGFQMAITTPRLCVQPRPQARMQMRILYIIQSSRIR